MTNTRKRFIVDPKLQYRIMGVMVAGGVAVCLVFLAGLYYFMTTIFGFLIEVDGISPEAKNELFMNWNKMLNFLMVLVGVTILGIWTWAHFFTNKIAGPIFNIIRKLEEFIAGDQSARIKLREKDYFHGLAESLNAALDKATARH